MLGSLLWILAFNQRQVRVWIMLGLVNYVQAGLGFYRSNCCGFNQKMPWIIVDDHTCFLRSSVYPDKTFQADTPAWYALPWQRRKQRRTRAEYTWSAQTSNLVLHCGYTSCYFDVHRNRSRSHRVCVGDSRWNDHVDKLKTIKTWRQLGIVQTSPTGQTRPNQSKPDQTRSNQAKPGQTRSNQGKPDQTRSN